LQNAVVLLVQRMQGWHDVVDRDGTSFFTSILGGIGARFMDVTVDNKVDIRVSEAEDLVDWREDDDGDLRATEDAELARLLEEAGPAFGEGDLLAALVCDFLDLNLLPPFAWFGCLGEFLYDNHGELLELFMIDGGRKHNEKGM